MSLECWRRLGLETLDAGRALARAEGLLAGMAPGAAPVLAWSVAEPEALVLGRAAGAPPVDREACRRGGVPVYQRASGGGPVLWGPELLALDVVLPPGHPLVERDVVASYAWLGQAIAAGLRDLGLDARVVPPAEARRQQNRHVASLACFGAISPYEVVVAGRKVAGLSQVRRVSGILLQAGVPLRLDPARLASLLDLPPKERSRLAQEVASRAAGLDELGLEIDASALTSALEGRIGAVTAGRKIAS